MTIHTILAAEQSSALRTLVSGSMKEAQAGTVNWEDVDEKTFARWAQFVYTGDYPPVSCNIVTEPTTSTEEATPSPELQPEVLTDQPLEDSWGFQSFSRTKKPTRKSDLFSERTKFHDLTYPVPSLSKFSNMCKIRPNESSVEDYSPVFLGHAQLYVFAEKWGIKSLQTLALHKLHATLCGYKPYEARYGDVVELIKYTYQNTLTQNAHTLLIQTCIARFALRGISHTYAARRRPVPISIVPIPCLCLLLSSTRRSAEGALLPVLLFRCGAVTVRVD